MDQNISIPKVFMAEYVAHRGYYMAVRRYEISLLVLKIFHSFAALTREIFSTLEEKFRISKRLCNVLFII